MLRDKVIGAMQVIKLEELKMVYVEELEKTDCKNRKFRGEKLKRKIEKHNMFSKKVSFVKLQEGTKTSTYLLFSRQMDVGSALRDAYKLGTQDNIREVALAVRKSIFEAQEECQLRYWPYSYDYLKKMIYFPVTS